MSTHVQSQFSLITSPPQNMAFGGDSGEASEFRLPRNYVHHSNFPILPPTADFHPSSLTEHSIPEGIRPCTPYLWHANHVFRASTVRPTSIHVNQQTQHNPTSWWSTDMQMYLESLPTASSPVAVNGMHGTDMPSASHSTYNPGLYGTYLDSHAAFDPPRTLWPNSSDRHLLVPPIEQDIRNLGHHLLHESSDYQSLSLSSHAACSHYPSAPNNQNVADPFIPHHLPSHPSFIPSSPQWCPHPTSTGYLEPDPRFRLVSSQDSNISSRRKRGARATEYGGLWIDEEELLKGLTEPTGKLNVHQCRWEEDRTPCYLWIKGDKSSINAHIQKWHGGKPGGDKHEVECRWSACGKAMLKESVARHIVSIHLGEMWECQGCGKEIARNDAYGRHAMRSKVEACRNAGALITYSADVRVIDVRAALGSGRRLRYADA